MKNLLKLALIGCAMLALAACSDDDPTNPSPYADHTKFNSEYLLFPMEDNLFYKEEDSSKWERFKFKEKGFDTIYKVIYTQLKYEHVSHYRPNLTDQLEMTVLTDSGSITTLVNGSPNYLYSFSYLSNGVPPAKVFCYADSIDYWKEITIYKEVSGQFEDVPCYAYYLQKDFHTRIITLFKKEDFRLMGQLSENDGVLSEKFSLSRPGYKLKK